MKYISLILMSFFLFNCTSDTTTAVSTNIVYTGAVSFMSGDSLTMNYGTMYIVKTTTDSAFEARTYKFDRELETAKFLTTNKGYLFLVSNSNLATSGIVDEGIVTFNNSISITTDSIADIAVDRHRMGYAATDKAMYKYALETLIAVDTINVIANKLTQIGDTILAAGNGVISIYEGSADSVRNSLTTTLDIKEMVGTGALAYILAADSNVYKKDLTTGTETKLTTTSDKISITISNGDLIVASENTVSAFFTNVEYTSVNTITKINGTRGAILSIEKDSLNMIKLQVIDKENMRPVFYQPLGDSIVISEK